MTTPDWRDTAINQAQQARLVADVKIAQKVGAAHRDAFKLKFPGQIEHCMRLTAERLQAVLVKTGDVDVSNPDTWIASAEELESLANALELLYSIHCKLEAE